MIGMMSFMMKLQVESEVGMVSLGAWAMCRCLDVSYLSNTPTNLCIALYCILLYRVVLNCNVLLIYCYVDIIQYNAVHKFVGVLDNPPNRGTVIGFNGATLHFEAANRIKTVASLYTHCRYTTVP